MHTKLNSISLLFSVLLLIGVQGYCQYYPKINLDTINKYNSKGRKTGYWLEYLNVKLRFTEKQQNSIFCRYAFYEKGLKIYPLPSYPHKVTKIVLKDGNIGSQAKRDTIVLMDGTYLLYSKQGNLFEEDCFEKGKYLYYKTFYKNGQTAEYEDYTKTYKGQPFSRTYVGYKENGDIEKKWLIFRKDNAWNCINIK